jgi:hypothetical protein
MTVLERASSNLLDWTGLDWTGLDDRLIDSHKNILLRGIIYTIKPALNGISRVQNIFPLKPGFRLIKVYYDSQGT